MSKQKSKLIDLIRHLKDGKNHLYASFKQKNKDTKISTGIEEKIIVWEERDRKDDAHIPGKEEVIRSDEIRTGALWKPNNYFEALEPLLKDTVEFGDIWAVEKRQMRDDKTKFRHHEQTHKPGDVEEVLVRMNKGQIAWTRICGHTQGIVGFAYTENLILIDAIR